MKKALSIFLIIITLILTSCSLSDASYLPPEPPINTNTLSFDSDGNKFCFERKELDDYTGDYILANGKEDFFIVGNCTDHLILEKEYPAENDSFGVCYYSYDVRTGKITEIYSPQNWSILFTPVTVEGNVYFEIINNSSKTNGLLYDIVQTDMDGNSNTILSGESYFYPLITAYKRGIAIVTFKRENDDISNKLSYYDTYSKEFKDIISCTYTCIDNYNTVTGDDLYMICGCDDSIIFQTSSYKDEKHMRGRSGKHYLYELDTQSGNIKALEFQPGYLCEKCFRFGEIFLVERKDTYNDMEQSGYIYIYNGTGYERWVIPDIAPYNSIRDVVQISKDILLIRTYSCSIIISIVDKEYYYFDTSSVGYVDGSIYYTSDDGIFKLNPEKLFTVAE